MGQSKSIIKEKVSIEPEKMSHEDAIKLCNEKRLELKLHRVKFPLLTSERCPVDEVLVLGKKSECEAAKKSKMMGSTQTIIKEKNMRMKPEKLSYQDAYKLCNKKRLEIKLRRIEIPVPLDEKSTLVTSKKRKRESAKTIESMIDTKKVMKANKETFFLTEDQIPLSPSKRCKTDEVRVHGIKKSEYGAAKKNTGSSIETKKDTEVYQDSFFLTNDQYYYVAGEDCSNLRRIECTYGVSLLVDDSTSSGRFGMTVKGPSADLVYAAKKYVLDKMPRTLIFSVPEWFTGRTRGRPGETVRRLREEFGVLISFEEGKTYISGIKNRSDADAIISIVSGKRKRTEAIVPSFNKRKKTVTVTP